MDEREDAREEEREEAREVALEDEREEFRELDVGRSYRLFPGRRPRGVVVREFARELERESLRTLALLLLLPLAIFWLTFLFIWLARFEFCDEDLCQRLRMYAERVTERYIMHSSTFFTCESARNFSPLA